MGGHAGVSKSGAGVSTSGAGGSVPDAATDAVAPPGDGGPPVGCAAPGGGTSVLPAGAPALAPGVWTNISPAGVSFHRDGSTDVFTQGITLDPCNAGTLYLSVSSFDLAGGHPGVYKSIDAGASWNKVGQLDEPIRIRVDPGDPTHLVAADGVRGGTMGFWVSHDGGETWIMPAGFDALKTQLFQLDVYDVAVDPADFDHALVTSHSPWNGYNAPFNAAWGANDSGILETTDGGTTWALRGPVSGWSHGNGIWFLDDSKSWLFGSQSDGFWRTTDGGLSFTLVVQGNNMQHGGGGVYRTKSGTYYTAGTPHVMRSTDSGATWTMLAPSSGYNSIFGDGALLYTAPVYPAAMGPTFLKATEADDTTWTAFGPTLISGPFEMAFDAANRILYAANWNAGLWALKVT
jgi:hypothetical protein